MTIEAARPRTVDLRVPAAQGQRIPRVSCTHRGALSQIHVARATQRHAFGFKLSLRELESRNKRVPQRLAKKIAEREILLLRPGLLPSPAPANLPHGGVLLENPPDLAIGRGLPPLQFQQPPGHHRFYMLSLE